MKINLKQLQPHAIAIGVFLVVSVLFCKPALDGLTVNQPDLMQWKGMAQDGFNYKEKHGDFPEWTVSMFGGMPAYAIAFGANAFIAPYLTKLLTLGLPEPVSYFFLCCITFYFLSQVLRIKPWIGIIGALAFAYSSYNPIIIVTGHHTKMMAIAYMPGLLGAVLLIFERRKYLLGTALTAIFTAAFVAFNHLQMVYYLLLVFLIMGVSYAIIWVRQKELAHLTKSAGLALFAGILGVFACAVNIFTTYDYAPETMRGGKANLDAAAFADSTKPAADAAAKASNGLDVDYAFRWSYGIAETLTLLVPNANGGGSEGFGEESKFYETLIEKMQTGQIDQNTAQSLSRFGVKYWGDQPFTSGPVYVGVVILLLAIVGLFAAPGRFRWWMLAATLLGIVMAWGSNFMGFNEFLFNNLPMYNKFRAPSQSLVIPQLLLPILGILGLQALFAADTTKEKAKKYLFDAGKVAAVLILVAVGYFFAAEFKSTTEINTTREVVKSNPQLAESVKEVLNAVADDRKGLYQTDLLKNIVLMGLAFAVLFFTINGRLKPIITCAILAVLVLADEVPVAKQYLGEEAYVEKDNTDIFNYVNAVNPALYKALSSLQADNDPHYRVFNTTTDPFNDALTSAMARSVGGYHPAKLSIYQDLIEYQLGKQNMKVYNMLNTKYFLVQGQNNDIQIQQNPGAMGAAWLAQKIQYVPDATAEMRSLDSTDLITVAVVQEKFKPEIAAQPSNDSTAKIALTKYDNDLIEYEVKANGPQFAVLSEIYYSRGWKAFANNKEVPIVKTNYVLRGIPLPAGTTNLRLEFKPESYYTGRMVTSGTEWFIVLLLLGAIFAEWRNSKNSLS